MSDNNSSSAAEKILALGASVDDLYADYQEVQKLGQLINGLAPSAPFPDAVNDVHVAVYYTIAGEQNERVARLWSDIRVGDVADLLSREADRLVTAIRQSCLELQELAGHVEAVCRNAQFVARAQEHGGPE